MNENKKELSSIQRMAIKGATMELEQAKETMNKIAEDVFKELGIDKEVQKWQFMNDFRFIQRINAQPQGKIPNKKSKE